MSSPDPDGHEDRATILIDAVVLHTRRPKWGRGVVIAVEGDSCTVAFTNGGARKLKLSIARLVLTVHATGDRKTVLAARARKRDRNPRSGASRSQRDVSLTALIDEPDARTAIDRILPRLRDYVAAELHARRCRLGIAPSAWTRRRHSSTTGTAYDYAVGLYWARASLDPVFERVNPVLDRRARRVAALVREVILAPGTAREDAFRALALLAHFDAVYRSPLAVSPPDWTLDPDTPIRTHVALCAKLREQYPDEFAREMEALLGATTVDLPTSNDVVYNPVFGYSGGSVVIGADGDVIADGVLIDLKTGANDWLTLTDVIQVLSYAALDRLAGNSRITSVGIYNPRFRFLWKRGVEDLCERGGGSFPAFCGWFARLAQ